jgi:phage-related protein
MAKSIIQRIALEGADAIKAQLGDIGDAGAKAFAKLQDAAKKIDLDLGKKFGPAIDAVPKQVEAVKNTVNGLKDAFGEVISKAGETVGSFAKLGGGAAAAVVGLVALVTSGADVSQKLNSVADSLGISAEKLHGYRLAAAQAGVSNEQFDKSLFKLADSMERARQSQIQFGDQTADLNKTRSDAVSKISEELAKTGDYTKANQDAGRSAKEWLEASTKLNREHSRSATELEKLGIAVTNEDGTMRALDDVLLDLADNIKALNDPLRQQELAFKALGDKSRDTVNFLKLGSEGILKSRREMEALAPKISELAESQFDRQRTALNKLQAVISSVKQSFLSFFAGPVADGLNALTELINSNRGAIMDFAATLSGQVNTAVQDFIKQLKGEAITKGGFVETMTTALTAFVEAAKIAGEVVVGVFKAIKAAADVTATALNELFGTKLTGGALIIVAILAKLTGTFGLIKAAISAVITVIAALVGAFGAVPVIIGIVAAAFLLWLTNAAGGLDGLQQKWNAVWTGIVQFFNTAVIQPIQAAWTAFVSFLGTVWQGIVALVTTVGAAIVAGWTSVVEGVKGVWNAIVTFFADLFAGIVTAIQEKWNNIVAKATECVNAVKEVFSSGLASIGDFFSRLESRIVSIFDKIIAKAKEFIAAAKEAVTSASDVDNAGAGGGGDPGFAGGGHVRGPGGTTGDRIRAWLSDNEYVHKARAVAKYGVGFMDAINNLRLSPDAVNVLMGGMTHGMAAAVTPGRSRFATGGLVMAGAGASSGGQPVNIHFGGEVFHVNAEGDELDRLTRAAQGRAVRTAGRKPTWFQG